MQTGKIALVKDNLSSFWEKCYSTNPAFQVNHSETVFHTTSDIDDAFMNAILASKLNPNEIEIMVSNLQKHYHDKNLSFCWWVDSATDDPALEMQLENNNFIFFGNVSGMVKLIDSSIPSSTSTDIDIVEVSNINELREWITPIQISFGMSDLSTEKYYNMFVKLCDTANAPTHFVAKFDGKVIASSTVFFGDETAGIYNCATLPDYRGKGALSLLTTKMLERINKQGYKQVTLQASPMSVSVFRKFGFEDVVPYKVYLMKR